MKRFCLVFTCVCLLSLITPQIPTIESSGIPSIPLALADEVTVPLALADKATLPPPPPGPVEPNPPPAFPPEPQPPAITHLSGQSRELELEIGNRILGFCAAEKEAIRSGDEAGLADFFSTVSEQKRIGDSLEVIESVWPPYIDSRQEEDKGTRRLDHEIDDPIIVIRENDALCYLREIFWFRTLGNPPDGSFDTAIGRYHSILLEKGASSWVIKYDLFGSAYTTLPAEAPLVKIEGSYGGDYFLSVSGFPSFKEILSVLPAKPQWYLEMMEKATMSSFLSSSPDRGAAVRYAETWWGGFNPNYPYFDLEADCANFVSQCLHEGGWSYDDSTLENPVQWYYGTDTWRYAGDYHDGQANGLCWYLQANGWPPNTPQGILLGTAAEPVFVARLEIGDVVCIEKGLCYDEENGWYYGHHVGICVGYGFDAQGNYTPLINAHSDQAYRVSLSTFGNGYPANQLYLYRVFYPDETTPLDLNKAGWHMVTPGVSDTLPAYQIFGPNLVACFEWDPYIQGYINKKYSPLSAGLGYWVKVSAPTDAYVSGRFNDSYFRENAPPNWNLIGSPFERITAWTNVWVYNLAYGYSLTMPAAKAAGWIQSIVHWNGNENRYDDADMGGWIWPGYGYWMKPAYSVTLTFWRP